jgi:hypothetical protein
LQSSSGTWKNSWNIVVPCQRSCRIMWRQHWRREIKTFLLPTLGNCSWRHHQCFMHLSLNVYDRAQLLCCLPIQGGRKSCCENSSACHRNITQSSRA